MIKVMISKFKRITIGAILRIDLGDGFYNYARILPNAHYAFYDSLSKNEMSIPDIIKLPVLFIVSVYNDVITSGRWRIVGQEQLESFLEVLPLQFIQDALNPSSFELMDSNTGKISKANKKDCIGFERAAVWDAIHVEQRIRDH